MATPGCYPTASLLALAPLARAGLIADLVIDAKQGLSGAGRSATWQTHFSNSGENILPYNIVHHRHTPEIEEQLDELDPRHPALRVQFTPHLVPLDQGELVNCYVTPTRPVEQDELDVMYEDAYAGEPFVEIASRASRGTRRARDQCLPAARRRQRPHRQDRGALGDRQFVEGDLLAGRPEPQPDVRLRRDDRAP